MYKIILEIAQGISVIAAAFSVFLSVESWRKEFTGKRRIELAEEVLSLFYQAKDAIRDIRSPASYIGEGGTRKKHENETERETEILNQGFIASERYEKHSELFSKIYTLRYRFMTLFGAEAGEPFEELRKIVFKIISSSRRASSEHLTMMRYPNSKKAEDYYERIAKLEEIFWEIDENDRVNKEVNQIIILMERECRIIIESKQTLFFLLNQPIGRKHNWIIAKNPDS